MVTKESTIAAPTMDGHLSYEDFLAQYDGVRAEWVDGKVKVMSPVAPRHTRLRHFLQYLLDAFVSIRKLGELLTEPTQTKLGPGLPGREPDLMFIAQGRLDIIKPTFVDGPPDLAIEIVSPESQTRDYGDKLRDYENAGVREYWIVDPLRADALFYQLDDEGIFRRASPDANGRYHSVVLPGLVLDVAVLWRAPLPDIVETVNLARTMGTA